jgi:putative SOS response-associated peptidase YedK
MPVMLMSEDYDRWLGPAASAAELKALLKAYDADLMEVYGQSCRQQRQERHGRVHRACRGLISKAIETVASLRG